MGKEAHDGGLADPGDLLEGEAALREGDEEEVASDVGAEDGEEVGAAELAVAEGLDGGGGIDAEAGIVIEEAARGDEKSGDDAERGQEGSGESQLAPAGTSPGGKEAATDGNAAACAEEGLFGSVVGVGTRTRGARVETSSGRRTIQVSRWFVENRRASVQDGFCHGPEQGRENRRFDYSVTGLWIGGEMQWESRERTGIFGLRDVHHRGHRGHGERIKRSEAFDNACWRDEFTD